MNICMKSIIKLSIITSFLVLILFTPFEKSYADNEASVVPQWIKHNALWWAQGEISDDDFIEGMEWLIEKSILPTTDVIGEIKSSQIPDSVKKIAYSWSQDKLPDAEFLRGIEYLIKNGVINLNSDFVSKVTKERLAEGSVWNDTKKSVVIIPVFTAAAYAKQGFYTYFSGKCDSICLTARIDAHRPLGYTASQNAVDVLQSLGYNIITDIDVDKNPKILSEYDKVIVLHNEYVTQKEFDAITGHPHVIYLYPNSLYAKIIVNYDQNTTTLVRGHNYPESKIRNGFDWKFDNSPLEYNTLCNNWKFNEITNGIMLNCYPESHLADNIPLLKMIKEY